MKKIMIMMLGLGITLSALAGVPKVTSTGHGNGGRHTTVIVTRPYVYRPYGLGFGYGFGYNPFYSPFAYNPFYYPYNGYQSQPSKLDLEIEQINNDYGHDIAEVRHDKTLSSSERKQKIRDLRHDKQNSIVDAKQKYYNTNDDSTNE